VNFFPRRAGPFFRTISAMRYSPALLGHRGARAYAVENTIPAFDLALEHGCDGFEFDLRLTACGNAVVCHDPEASGMKIARADCNELRGLPRFEEVLERFASKAFLDIELKVSGLESIVLTALRRYPPERGYVVSSFLPEVITELRSRSANIPLGIICDRKKQLDRWPELPVEYVISDHALITRELIAEVHRAGNLLMAWTVNSSETMLQLAEWDADAIISDDTELLVHTLR
jgi:glycerophosphoryl diester phosphodiesterase